MHEHSFIEAIVRNIEDRENVNGIVLEVGELVGIEPGHLKEHIIERFGFAPKGVLPAQVASAGADKVGNVEVVVKKSRVKCECGFEGEARVLERLHDLVIFECPGCGGIPEVLEGKDIKILKVVYN